MAIKTDQISACRKKGFERQIVVSLPLFMFFLGQEASGETRVSKQGHNAPQRFQEAFQTVNMLGFTK